MVVVKERISRFQVKSGIIRSSERNNEPVGIEQKMIAIGDELEFEIRCKHHVIPSDSRLTNELNKLLIETVGEKEVREKNLRICVYHDSDENGLSLPNGAIYLSTGILEIITSKEALQALIYHEYIHIRDMHATTYKSTSCLSNLGKKRMFEGIADIESLIQLDKAGVNPYGAIELHNILIEKVLPKIREMANRTTRHLIGSKLKKIIIDSADIQPTHGTFETRRMNLMELCKLIPLRNLSHKLTPIDLKPLIQEFKVAFPKTDAEWISLNGLDFWSSLSRALNYSMKKEKAKQLAEQFIKNKIPNLNDRELLAALEIVETMINNDINGNETTSIEEFTDFLASQKYNLLELPISSENFYEVVLHKIKKAIENSDAPEQLASSIGKLNETILQRMKFEDKIIFDTEIINCFLTKKCIKGSLRVDNISKPKKIIVLEEPFKSYDGNELLKFYSECKMGLLHLDTIFDNILEKINMYAILGLSSVIEANQQLLLVPKIANVGINISKTLSSLFCEVIGQVKNGKNKTETLLNALNLINGEYNFLVILIKEDETKKQNTKKKAQQLENDFNYFSLQNICGDQCQRLLNIIKRILEEDSIIIDIKTVCEHFKRNNSIDRETLFYTFRKLDTLYSIKREYINTTASAQDEYTHIQRVGKNTILNHMIALILSGSSKRTILKELDKLILFLNGDIEVLLDQLQEIVRNLHSQGISNIKQFTKDELATCVNIAQKRKTTILSSNIENLRELPTLFSKYPIGITTLPQKKFESLWKHIEENMIKVLKDNKEFPRTADDYELILCYAALAQDITIIATLIPVCFEEMIRLSNFEKGMEYIEKYSQLPFTLLQQGYEIFIETKAKSKEEVSMIRDWFSEKINVINSKEHEVALAELAVTSLRFIETEHKLEFLEKAISTYKSDEEFKKFVMKMWWQKAIYQVAGSHNSVPYLYYDLDEILFAIEKYAQHKNQYEKRQHEKDLHEAHLWFERAIILLSDEIHQNLVGQDSFTNFYEHIMTMHPISAYLLIRGLLLEGNNAIYKVSEKRRKLMESIIRNYVDLENSKNSQIIHSLVHSISTVPSASELFYFTGTLISTIAFQNPEQTFSNEEAAKAVILPMYLEKESNRISMLSEDQRKLLEKVLAKRLVAIARGKPFEVKRNPENDELVIIDKKVLNSNKELINRLNEKIKTRRIISERLSLIDLGILIAEHMGALGIKWLQLMGMYMELSEEDRKKINKVYDRVKSLSKIQVFDLLEQSAKTNSVLAKIFEDIVSYEKTLGGGSLFSVHEVIMQDGTRLALSIQRPGAMFIVDEMKELIEKILEDMIKNYPDDHNIRFAKTLLNDAVEWFLLEIKDTDYERKNMLFWMHNDSQSTYEHRFRADPSFRHQLSIPQLRHTGDTWIRLEEKIDCLTLAQAEIGDETDLEKKTVSVKDAKEISALVAQNFLYQVFETGLVHPDIHPGNVVLGHGQKVYLLDRKALIKLSQEDKNFLKILMLEAIGNNNYENMIRIFIDRYGKKSMQKEEKAQLIDKLVELIRSKNNTSNTSVENYIAPVLLELRKENIEIPLHIELVFKSLLGVNRISVWAGFKNLGEALLYSPNGTKDYVGLITRTNPSIGAFEIARISATLGMAVMKRKGNSNENQ